MTDATEQVAQGSLAPLPAPRGTVTVRGVVLEGSIGSGKTTLAHELATRLARCGESPLPRKCLLYRSALTDSLRTAAFESLGDWRGRPFPDPDFLRGFNVHMSAATLIDAACTRGDLALSEHVYVQDRYWFSQWSKNEFFTPGEAYLSKSWVASAAPRFTVQLYLTCPTSVRAERLRLTKPKTPLHAYLADHVDVLCRFDEWCRALAEAQPDWEVVDANQIDDVHLSRWVDAASRRRRSEAWSAP